MPNAPTLGGGGTVTLDADVFETPFNGPLVHEVVVAELAARRRGTHATKTRGMVSGGGSKPWRQKGTGRARAGTIRAAQFTGGGVVFPPSPRSFDVKVNKKAYRSALRSALSAHVEEGSLAIVDPASFDEPSTRTALGLLQEWGKERPVVVVALSDQETVVKSFRNLDRVLVVEPSEVEVASIVWARALVVTEAALELLQKRAAS
jgi:large subunit ribosomal protein L4